MGDIIAMGAPFPRRRPGSPRPRYRGLSSARQRLGERPKLGRRLWAYTLFRRKPTRSEIEAGIEEAEREIAAPPAGWREINVPVSRDVAAYLLLWDAAADLGKERGDAASRHWLVLMDAIRRGELGRQSVVLLFHDGVTLGVQVIALDVDTLFGAPAERCASWTAADYRAAAGDHAWMLDCDPEGRLGLAVERAEFERWRAQRLSSVTPRADATSTSSASISAAKSEPENVLSASITAAAPLDWAVTNRRGRGRPSDKADAVKAAMQRDMAAGIDVARMTEKEMKERYRASRDTCRKARAGLSRK